MGTSAVFSGITIYVWCAFVHQEWGMCIWSVQKQFLFFMVR